MTSGGKGVRAVRAIMRIKAALPVLPVRTGGKRERVYLSEGRAWGQRMEGGGQQGGPSQLRWRTREAE